MREEKAASARWIWIVLVLLAWVLAGCRTPDAANRDGNDGDVVVPTEAIAAATVTRAEMATATERAVTDPATATPTRQATATASVTIVPATSTATATATATPTATTVPADGATETPTATATSAPDEATTTPGPRISAFSVQPQSLTPGGSVTVSWEAAGQQVELCLQVPFQDDLVTRACEPVPATGTMDYALDPVYRNEVLLLLRATGGGSQVEESARVGLPCPDDWWFFDNPPEHCPAADPVVQQAAAQRFERGLMVWLSQTGVYYVFYAEAGSPYTAVYDPLDVTGTGDPPPDEPPAGLHAPTSGFGLLWRGEVAGVEPLAERLGWALAPEFNYEAVTQVEASDRYARTFLRSPDGEILALHPAFFTFERWLGPGG